MRISDLVTAGEAFIKYLLRDAFIAGMEYGAWAHDYRAKTRPWNVEEYIQQMMAQIKTEEEEK